MSATSAAPAAAPPKRGIETFAVTLPWLKQSDGLRLDASFYNPRVAEALAILRRSGLELKTLDRVTRRIYLRASNASMLKKRMACPSCKEAM